MVSARQHRLAGPGVAADGLPVVEYLVARLDQQPVVLRRDGGHLQLLQCGNVIPGELVVDFNLRYSTESTPEGLRERVETLLKRHGLNFELSWVLGGLPFLTRPGALIAAMSAAITAETGVVTELSTTGGTSDGRFVAQICPQVVEFGPINASIHKIDEHGEVADLAPLTRIYRRTLADLLG